jgi:hypothetical protein
MKGKDWIIFALAMVFVFGFVAIAAYGQSTKTETENLITEVQKFGVNLVEWHIGYKSDVYEPYYVILFLQIDETMTVTFAGTDIHDLFRQIVQYRKNMESSVF